MRSDKRVTLAVMLVIVAGVVGLPASASAHSGPYAVFNDCPTGIAEAEFCLHSETVSGTIILGKKTTPIESPVTLQGGYTEENEAGVSKFIAAADGNTLSKTPQKVPGGLAGLVDCDEISNSLARAACELAFENGLTGVNATLELARPANEIVLDSNDLLGESGVALKLPVKIHLENPLLGSSCYVGSSASPIIWNLTTGTTSPPSPNKPISGTSGEANTLEEGRITTLTGTRLVDNAWSAPAPEGCGGVFAFAIDPLIEATVGVPAAAGENTAILNNNIEIATTTAVRNH
jgi:hypothetical protein